MADASAPVSGSSRPFGPLAFKAAFLCLLGFAVLNGWLIWMERDPISRGYGDFASFYTAGKIVQQGQSARLYEPRLQWNVQQEFASTVAIRKGPLPYIRPPFEALLFLPFAYLNYPAACVVWIALKAILLLSLPFLLPFESGARPVSPRALEILLCFSFFPVGFDLIQGQDSILLLLIVVVGLRFLLRGADLSAGAVLALGLFKFHLMIPFLAIFLLRKKGRVVLGFLVVATLLLALSLAMVGWAGLAAYPRYLWSLNHWPGLGMVNPQGMPNVRGLMTIFLGNGPFPTPAHWFLAGVVVLGVIVAARFWRRDDRWSEMTGYSFAIVVVLATSYYANSYDMTLLLLPLLLLGEAVLRDRGPAGWPRTLFLAASAALLCTPLSWVLAIRIDQYRWMALSLAALAVSIFALEKIQHQENEIARSQPV